MRCISLACALLLILAASCAAQSRGKGVPPLDESKIVRHYWLVKNGGIIEISPKDAADTATMDLIQKHCEALSAEFNAGSFESSVPAGSTPPPSIAQLKKLKNQITFAVAQTDTGWSVRMLTIDPTARQAVLDFLRFQITERKTGDPTTDE